MRAVPSFVPTTEPYRVSREQGRQQLESFRLAPWASRRRRDLLELTDRLNPTIAELTQAIEREVEKCPEAQRLRTHPGVGALTALAFVLIIGKAERFGSGKMARRLAVRLYWMMRQGWDYPTISSGSSSVRTRDSPEIAMVCGCLFVATA